VKYLAADHADLLLFELEKSAFLRANPRPGFFAPPLAMTAFAVDYPVRSKKTSGQRTAEILAADHADLSFFEQKKSAFLRANPRPGFFCLSPISHPCGLCCRLSAVRCQLLFSNIPAAPMPPPTHIVTMP
jgi:hypothetical protein